MYTQHGEVEGIKWLSEYLGGRKFMLYVGDQSRPYTCEHEPIFGVDVSDYASMNEIMDKMQEKTPLTIGVNEPINKRLKSLQDEKNTMKQKYSDELTAKKDEQEKDYQSYLSNKNEDTPHGLMYEFITGHLTYSELVKKIGGM